ncbi:hypothetical protein C8Q77DRAFT_1108393 [Trametes polyzona]|nr:hypothetical protein C8Q77DRAFT_1108393 [Trametes polyzona]
MPSPPVCPPRGCAPLAPCARQSTHRSSSTSRPGHDHGIFRRHDSSCSGPAPTRIMGCGPPRQCTPSRCHLIHSSDTSFVGVWVYPPLPHIGP